LGLLLTVTTCSAFAQGNAIVVGQSLALAGGFGGICAGLLAAWLGPHQLRFWPSFGVYIGLLAVIASTWTGTMEVVPLTLALGSLVGLLPYAAGFFLASRAFTRLLAVVAEHRSSRK